MDLRIEREQANGKAPSKTVLTLSRSTKGNALTAELVENLIMALGEAESEGLLVLKGAGRHFCTGFDLSNLQNQSDGDLLLRFVRLEYFMQLLEAFKMPTIAVAQGRSIGAGADIFVACEKRLCLADATFVFPGPSFGLVLGSRRLSQRVGREAARDILLSGRVIEAEEATHLGLATSIIEESQIDEAIAYELEISGRLSCSTVGEIRSATIFSHDDRDMANLVRSAMKPGLQQRIANYLASIVAQHGA